ncbi:MAG: translation initiation factor IF-3 [Bacilli bacterium]
MIITGIYKRVSQVREPAFFHKNPRRKSLIYNNYQQGQQKFRPRSNYDRELINDRIHFKEVLLIGPEGESFGVVPLRVALQKSMDMQLDLFCVSPNAVPPVCKIINFGKYKFEQDKKEKEMKKNQKKTVLKEIRFTATTDKHDLETKAKAAIGFLQEGMKVKVAVYIKGRMMQRMDIVETTLKTFLDLVKDYSVMEKQPELLGKDYFVMLSPKSTKK